MDDACVSWIYMTANIDVSHLLIRHKRYLQNFNSGFYVAKNERVNICELLFVVCKLYLAVSSIIISFIFISVRLKIARISSRSKH